MFIRKNLAGNFTKTNNDNERNYHLAFSDQVSALCCRYGFFGLLR